MDSSMGAAFFANSAIDFVSFGPFRLYPVARVLERDGAAVCLGSRALDILIALVEHAGAVVSHRQLISRGWRGLVVDTGNLRVQIANLRKGLGDSGKDVRYIANVPGQGYSFVAPISVPGSRERPALAGAHAELGRETNAFPAIRLFTQTLDALLDSNYRLLSAGEQAVLRRLSIFVGPFTMNAALAVASERGMDESRLVRAIEHLVAMALLSITATEDGVIRYRLLRPVRAYALDKLVSSGEAEVIASRASARLRVTPVVLQGSSPRAITNRRSDQRMVSCLDLPARQ